jgi:Co/Zn/Cd efflux system component
MEKRDESPGPAEQSEFAVPRMDCPSEERTIRMALDGLAPVRALSFDLPGRRLTVWHEQGAASVISERLEPLGLGAHLVETRTGAGASAAVPPPEAQGGAEARTLWVVLGINAVMFVVELVGGLLVQSTGLLADSLDMFADAAVYGLSLYAVGRAAAHKLRAARVSGVLQLVLALGALFEVLRRTLQGSEPEPAWMSGVAALALVANVTCLVLVSRHREGGAHMKASYIFSTNDVLANLGVMVAGALVAWTGSRFPDLVVGALIGLLVLSGAVRILRLHEGSNA